MFDGDVLLGELIVRQGLLPRESVDRALAEVARRRATGQPTDLSRFLVEASLADKATLERLARETPGVGPRDAGYLKQDAIEPRPSQRLGPASTSPGMPTPVLDERPGSKRFDPPDVGRFTSVIPAVPRPARKSTGRLDPPPAPRPVIPTPPVVSATPRTLGRAWGSYEILGEVARGAMGAVYRARDTRRGGQEVALKVLLQGNKAEGEDLERFKREARSLARLAHPSIVRVYDYGVHEGCPFITMDFVAGTTLESIVKGGGLPVERGLVIVEEVARAVDHAHSRGVVHRDLKPANILIGADGRARITDFGLAKILDEGQRLTRAGDLIGTPLYMSPEQIRGDLTALGPSADVWSLGVTLYLLLTGEQPFGAKTIDEVAKRVQNEEPVPPDKVRPAISRDLSRICLTALAKDPARRYQSAGELASDLRHYLHGKAVLAGRVTPLLRLRRALRAARLRLGSGTSLLILAGLGLVSAVTIGIALQLAWRAKEGGPRSVPGLDRLEALVSELKAKASSPEEAARLLDERFRKLGDDVASDPELLARGKLVRALGHRRLAAMPLEGRGGPHAADDWEATQLLLAARYAAEASTAGGRTAPARLEAASCLEAALVPLARCRNLELRRSAQRILPLLEPSADDPGVRAIEGRIACLVGDWTHARAALETAIKRGLAGPERDAAVLALVDALDALGEPAKAIELAKAEQTTALGADAALRSYRLALAEARATRLHAGRREGKAAVAFEDLRAKIATASEAPQALRTALALEEAVTYLDAGAPAAALDAIRALPAEEDDPAVVVARARAAVLGERPQAVASVDSLVAIALAVEVEPDTRASAALAAAERTLEDPRKPDPAAVLARIAGAALPSPVVARVAFARAAPAVLEALARLSGEWLDREHLPAIPERYGPEGLSSLAGRGGRDAEVARAWLLLLARADLPGEIAPDELVRSLSDQTASPDAWQALAIDAATASVNVQARDRDDWLARHLWTAEAQPAPAPAHCYQAASAERAESGPLRHLLALATDRLALATAWFPRPTLLLRGEESAAPHPPDETRARLDDADRLLDVAARRDPLSARVHRMRAEVALARAELSLDRRSDADVARDSARVARGEAACAALLDPYDRANATLMVRVALAFGDEDLARVWATRVRAASRGDADPSDMALAEAVATSLDASRDATELERAARLLLVASALDRAGADKHARALVKLAEDADTAAEKLLDDAEHADRRAEEQARAFSPADPSLRARQALLRYSSADPLSWGEVALAWEPAIDRGFFEVSVLKSGEEPEAEVDADPRKDLARALVMTEQLEAQHEPVAAARSLEKVRALLAPVFAKRPRSLAPRLLLDHALAVAGTRADAVEAASDLRRLEALLHERADAGAWGNPKRDPPPAIPAASLAIALARIDPDSAPRVTDLRARDLLAREGLKATFARRRITSPGN